MQNINSKLNSDKERTIKEQNILSKMKKVELSYSKSLANESDQNKIHSVFSSIPKRKGGYKPVKLNTEALIGIDDDLSPADKNRAQLNNEDLELNELLEAERERNLRKKAQEKLINFNDNLLSLEDKKQEEDNINKGKLISFIDSLPKTSELKEKMNLINQKGINKLINNDGIASILTSVNLTSKTINDTTLNCNNKEENRNKSTLQNNSQIKDDSLLGKKTDRLENCGINNIDPPSSSANLSIQQHNKIEQNKDDMKEFNPYDSSLKEPLIGKGVYNTLKILSTRGILNEKFFVGRYKDENPYNNYLNDKDKIQIEYRDDLGRLMTSKQANRYLSKIFQGKTKRENKTEKELLKDQLEEMKHNKDVNKDSLMLTMLRRHQEKFKTPGMILHSNKTVNH